MIHFCLTARWVIGVGVVCLSTSSCCAINTACTLATCFDGLVVEVSASGTSPVVNATADNGEQRRSQCDEVPCIVFFDGFHPQEVTLNVTADGNAVTITARPDYEKQQPNGPCCGPTCRNAVLKVTFPTVASL